ncbi:MAG TPA: primosomal protein N' [Maribacter sp.]|uniref:replication restart helicase PriA n=1 Tax=unclassified Maribacter TaxID=2615042 RepID=UPI000ED83051|nr:MULTISPECIES: primosomal protein N' [unclassified Maribacter]HAF78888.1 primosomal protein N' [Maribacter sp.]HAI38639.1 primosomal protein N' [Maribacter sp.]|tara:strand:+ start:121 stop:2577 length:2457 start_codon:yes stop_codon:yes gene_type:complete
MLNFVNVILPIPLERSFTYAISDEEALVLQPGMRVAVPFGKSKIYTAIIYSVHQNPPEAYEAKEIHEILDDYPIVTPVQLKHWEWIASYYMCTLGEVVRSALPGAFLLESETLILRNTAYEIDENELLDDEFLVFEALQHQSILKVQEVSAIIERKNVLPILQRLLDKNVILLKEEVYEQYKPKLVRYVKLGAEHTSDQKLEELLNSLTRAPKQSQVVLSLFQLQGKSQKPIKVSGLEKASNSSKAVIKSLVDKGILEEYFIKTDRVNYEGENDNSESKDLNEYQEAALADIKSSFEAGKVTLLKGVTSSGKTEVYVKLIEECLEKGLQALYLLPEIALTTQLISRLQEYFGEKIAIYHSKYNVQERVEVWQNVLQSKPKAQLVIGARSAMYLPFGKLGLIIVDEEHEGSFKQFDPAPRYHARDAAIVLGHFHKANILLGSATPSVESYYNTQTGKYGYAEITRRYGNVLMPDMELVDIKEAQRKRKMKGHFSERLFLEMEETLKEGSQIILFQNRRGFAPLMECLTCGHSPQCPNCDVSLTYHQYRNQLRCHYCGHHTALPEACFACGSPELDTKGFGTEQIEKEVKELFPEAKVGRMDLDTTRGKHGYEKIINAFEQQELDVLVGTQMLTKGLDFRNVNLVGVMNADSLLNFPDYRAHEKTYQLLTQVSGRAGRTKKRGKVLIQTYNPYHQILKQVTTGDYVNMYKEQLYEREQFKYPPVNRIIKVTFKHKNYNVLNEAADWFTSALRTNFGGTVLGPEYPPVARIRNQYLKHIVVKVQKANSLVQTKANIRRIEKSFKSVAMYRSVRVIYNVDHI